MLGASAEFCRWYLFSQTPEPKLALISKTPFGSHADGREVGARFYGMSTDPEPIRIGLRGIRVDPQPDRGERLRRSGKLTTNQKKPFQHRAES